ncbi:uncharacterized protein LOC133174156 [Saccostrea echinata]|uniref:uncharacterized protein LOC133174156 n=1 Tax=Saccostrea echinata TaxID=191078 RepID=UPI002A7EFC98|nr:uncharacterized protein LOC133174156 [Saccostrea echinata]
MGPKKNKRNKTPVQGENTQEIGYQGAVGNEKKEMKNCPQVIHGDGDENNGDKTYFNQKQKRNKNGSTEQSDYCTNDAVNSSVKTTENVKNTQKTTEVANALGNSTRSTADFKVRSFTKTPDENTCRPHGRTSNGDTDNHSEGIVDKSPGKKTDNPDETNNSMDCHSVEGSKTERTDKGDKKGSGTKCNEEPNVYENQKSFEKRDEPIRTQNEAESRKKLEVSENKISILDKRDEQTQTQNESEFPANIKVSENEISISDTSKRDDQTQTQNESEFPANIKVSENEISISDTSKRDEQTQTQDVQIKNKTVTIVLVLYGLLILLLLYLVLNASFSSIHVPRTTDEALKKISDIIEEFGPLKLENSKLDSKIDNLEKEVQKKKDEISRLYAKMVDLQKMVDNLREKLPFLAGKMKWMEQEQTEQGNYILLFLVIFLLIFLGITYLVMRRKETQPILSGQVQSSVKFHSKVGDRTHTSVLDQIHPKNLNKKIGIVSFNTKTQKVHKEMLQRALNSTDTNTEIVAVVVDRADKILTIHPSCLMFIFVDRNDRNIILEDPDSEIGDLRRLTTQGVMKMGCTVVVVYVNDRESRDLHGRDLYNPCLQSVKRHPVLKELQAEGRVFSVMDNFSQNQNKQIDQLLKKCGL